VGARAASGSTSSGTPATGSSSGFVEPTACEEIVARPRALVDAFEPETISIFTTNEQTRTSDEYFLESSNDVRFFFEEEAFAPGGSLRQEKSLSINKIGHALHELDPVFRRVSKSEPIERVVSALAMARLRSCSRCTSSRIRTSAATCSAIKTRRFSIRIR